MKFRVFVLTFFLLLAACDSDEPPPIPTPTEAALSELQANQEAIVPTNEEVMHDEAGGASAETSYPPPLPTTPPEPTPVPTATPRPIAATVNGIIIYLDEFEARLAQFQEWYPAGTPDGTPLREFTLDNLITQEILEQAAEANNIVVSDAIVNNAINQAIEDSGGPESYQVWLTQSGLTEETFRTQVTDEILAQAVVGFVTQDVKLSDEFVRARYIQVDDFAMAQRVQQELQAGADFGTLVDLYSVEPSKATTRGDLGFFSRGTLLVRAVEDAAFALQPNQVSDIVIHTRDDGSQTFFLVQTIERDSDRRLTAQQYSDLLAERFETWLADQRANADIQIVLDN